MNFLKGLGITILVIASIVGLEFISLGYKGTFGVWHKDASRKQFTHTQSYVQGVTNDLSKFKLELTKTEDAIERQAIINTINERFADFDASAIENRRLRNFLIEVQEGEME